MAEYNAGLNGDELRAIFQEAASAKILGGKPLTIELLGVLVGRARKRRDQHTRLQLRDRRQRALTLNREHYHDSAVIDPKYSVWNSREAQKVPGYAAAFGVRNAVVICKDVESIQRLDGCKICGGLSRFVCSGSDAMSLWVMSLMPMERKRGQNVTALDEFVGRCLVR